MHEEPGFQAEVDLRLQSGNTLAAAERDLGLALEAAEEASDRVIGGAKPKPHSPGEPSAASGATCPSMKTTFLPDPGGRGCESS